MDKRCSCRQGDQGIAKHADCPVHGAQVRRAFADRRAAKPVQTTPCRHCSRPTPMLGTRMCDGCWELVRSVQSATPLTLLSVLRAELDAGGLLALTDGLFQHLPVRIVCENTMPFAEPTPK